MEPVFHSSRAVNSSRAFHFSATCPVHFRETVHVLHDEPAVLVGMRRRTAARLGREHHGTVAHAHLATPRHDHEVDIELGEMHRVDVGAAMVAVSWHHVHGAPWFPDVAAEIEVAALSERDPMCELSFFGSYHPHYGPLGLAFDRLGGHRLVDETLARFFEHACDHLFRVLLEERLDTGGERLASSGLRRS